ncbi:streptophobe family protein [Streptomyces scopuliridis]|uniref:streptophobe family protein n=1 Tax=Streptomyces scopuliridis TaxID=452529 RepID=UPI0035DB6A89
MSHTTPTSSAPRSALPPRPSHAPKGPRPSARRTLTVTAGQNLAAGAGSAVAAFISMLAVSFFGLTLMGASSVTSCAAAAPAIVALAVGGTVTLSAAAGGGLMSMGVGGSLHGMPLGVTLTGVLVLGTGYFWRLRGQRITADLLFARAATAAGTWLVLLLVFVPFGQGQLRLPDSVSDKLTPGSGGGMRGGGLGGLLGGGGGGMLGGGGGLSSGLSSVNFEADVPLAVFAGLVWLVVVLAIGVVATRRPRLPVQFATGRLRSSVGPVIYAAAKVLVWVSLPLTFVGAIAAFLLGGDNGGRAAGAALLAAPNAVLALISTGLGAPWSLSLQSTMDSSSPISGMLGGGGLGGGGLGGGGLGGLNRKMNMADALAGSLTARLGVLLFVLVVMLASGLIAVSRNPAAGRWNGYTRTRRAALIAVQTGLMWATVFVAADLLAGLSLTANMSIMQSPLMTISAIGGAANALTATLLGMFVAAAVGWLSSVIHDTYRTRRPRHDP